MKWLSRIFPRASISAYLLTMTMIVTMPLVGFMGFLILRLQADEQDDFRREVTEDVLTTSRSMDRRLQEMKTTLGLLSEFPELRAGDMQSFNARIQASLRTDRLYVIVAKGDGQQLLNTRSPFGQPLRSVPPEANIAAVLSSGAPLVSDVFMGRTSNTWVFNVAMPVDAGDSGHNVLIMTQSAADLRQLLPTENAPGGWSTSILDSRGNVVISSDEARYPTGTAFVPEPGMPAMTLNAGSFEGTGRYDGETFAYARLPGWSWTAVMHGPARPGKEAFSDTWRQLIIGSLVIVSTGLAGAYAVGRQLSTSVREISRMAEHMGQGNIVSPVGTRVLEVDQIAEALSNASFDRAQAEDRTHIVLHELVHRSRNVLTLVQAMMRQLAREHDTISEFQKAVDHRLRGLGASIKALGEVQWRGVSVKKLIVAHLETFGTGLDHVKIEGTDLVLAPETAQNLGLILHELATNSMKYGALSVEHGLVTIEWKTIIDGDEEKIHISWTESGGPPAIQPASKGFGSTIIKRHAEAAFGAVVDIHYGEGGLRWDMMAPLRFFRLDNAPPPPGAGV